MFSHVRADLEASGAPKTFWPQAAAHAADILNRTTCPPHDRCTCYEALTGDKPRVMSIWPFGCRAYAVKPKPKRSKTSLDSTAIEAINLGRSAAQPGAYLLWNASEHKVVSASDVWFDETYMPWRKAGDRRIGDPVPTPGDADAAQPPTLPMIEDGQLPTGTLGTLAAEFDRVIRREEPGLPKTSAARLSKRVLVLFSGPYARPDGLVAELLRRDLAVTAIDSDSAKGGDSRHDILDNACYESLLRRVQRGEYVAIFAAPPCSTFSISRFVRSSSSQDGGPPAVRFRSLDQVTGAKECDPSRHKRELQQANKVVSRMCGLLRAAAEVGTEFAIENPADRGDPTRPELFMHPEHAPLWLMPQVKELSQFASCRDATFPMCAFGAPYLKHTTFLFTPGLEHDFQDLDNMRCPPGALTERAGGEKVDGQWNSARAAAYPSDLNRFIAAALSRLVVSREEVHLPAAVERHRRGAGRLAHEGEPPSASRSTTILHTLRRNLSDNADAPSSSEQPSPLPSNRSADADSVAPAPPPTASPVAPSTPAVQRTPATPMHRAPATPLYPVLEESPASPLSLIHI